ncbi:MFS transporter [Terrarubrum flagellatum]|uniref:MFS transporter n=1 Tax=Terrirubrum flagellatum TaxID=2895980 RepID=UPI003145024E
MSDSLSAATAEELDAPPAAEERENPAWAAVFSLTLGVFGLVTAEFLPASLLTRIAADLGVTDGAAGQAVTATAVVAMITALATAIVTRGVDRRVVIWSLTVLLIISNLLAATANGLTMLLAARVLLGIGLGGFWSMAAATAMRLVPERLMPRAMSIILTGVSFATVSAAPVGAYLGDLVGWRTVFLLAAGVGVGALFVQAATMPKLPPLASPDIRTLFELLKRPSVRMSLIAVIVAVSGHFAGFTYVRPFLEQAPRFSVEAISLVLLAYGIGGFFGNFAGAAIVERSAQMAVILGSLFIALTAFVLVMFGGSGIVTAAAVAIWGFAFGALPVGFQTWINRAAPDQAESAGGLLVAAFQIAIASGAVFGGLLVDGLGAQGAIGYCAAATLVGALLVQVIGRRVA